MGQKLVKTNSKESYDGWEEPHVAWMFVQKGSHAFIVVAAGGLAACGICLSHRPHVAVYRKGSRMWHFTIVRSNTCVKGNRSRMWHERNHSRSERRGPHVAFFCRSDRGIRSRMWHIFLWWFRHLAACGSFFESERRGPHVAFFFNRRERRSRMWHFSLYLIKGSRRWHSSFCCMLTCVGWVQDEKRISRNFFEWVPSTPKFRKSPFHAFYAQYQIYPYFHISISPRVSCS